MMNGVIVVVIYIVCIFALIRFAILMEDQSGPK